MKTILFLCTGNSCRSQMAEGWAKHFSDGRYQVRSAGIEKHGLNPRAVAVMAESGIDISEQTSKTVDEIEAGTIDTVFTVCGHADETCPAFPGAQVTHVGFEDPPKLTRDMNDEEEILSVYRRVRDEIRDFVERSQREWN